VKIDMNWVPSIDPPAAPAVESEFIEPPPPATSRKQEYSTTQTELEASVPALPPKPNNNWSVNYLSFNWHVL
jgi:hypothetical protein